MSRSLIHTAFAASFVAVLLFVVAAHARTLSVIKETDVIRLDCRFSSQPKAKVKYGNPLEVITQEGDWYKVRYQKITGCIHQSAVEEKQVNIKGVSSSVTGKGYTSVSKEEIGLAGKGFNKEVEEAFQERHPDLDFETVDRIEAFRTSDETLRKFIKNGGLNEP